MAKSDFTWADEPVWQRVIRCIRMLAIHGIITSGERDKALARAKKRYKLTPIVRQDVEAIPSSVRKQP